jgi:hypothetical protein
MAAMGSQSALVRLLARGGISTNVMTTNTTLIAINTTEALLGWIASSPTFGTEYRSVRKSTSWTAIMTISQALGSC